MDSSMIDENGFPAYADQSGTSDLNASLDSQAAASVAAHAHKGSPLRRSCELCRSSKSRCAPSRDDPKRCQKCASQSKECVFVEARQRSKKMRTSKARVAEMETKLESLISILASGNKPSAANALIGQEVPVQNSSLPVLDSTGTSSAGSFAHNTPASSESTSSARDFGSAHRLFFDQLAPTTATVPRKSNHSLTDVIANGTIPFEEAEYYVQDFKDYASQFPFVIILPHENLDSIRRERPFVLLSILAVTSQFKQKLQSAIEKELREFFAKKVIVEGVKSLDLLQGLLLYLAWYQFHFDPQTQQIYQFTQMAVAMAVDLGITKARKEATNIFEVGSGRTRLSRPEIVEMRTYLGCFYISSTSATGFRKPNNMKHTSYIDYCCSALKEMDEVPSDRLLTPFIQLERISGDVSLTFDYDGANKLPARSALRTDMLGKGFRQQLSDFQRTYSKDIAANATLRLCYNSLAIFINEIALHATPPPIDASASNMSNIDDDWYASTARADTLLMCYEATKAFLDNMIKFSDAEIRRMTMMDAIKMVYAFLILARFALPAPIGVTHPSLPTLSQLQETANLEYYLNVMAERSGSLVNVVDGKEEIGYFWHFKKIFQNTQIWSQTVTKSGESMERLRDFGFGNTDCVDMSFMRILSLEPTRQMILDECPPEQVEYPSESNRSAYGTKPAFGMDMGMTVPMGSGLSFEGVEILTGKQDSGPQTMSGENQDDTWMDLVGEWNASFDPAHMPYIDNPNLYGRGPL